MIVKRGKKYLVMDSKGKKVLGTHASESSAKKQLTAIHISQHKNESRILKFSNFISEDLMTLEYHDILNPDFWEGNELKPEVREKLLQIGKEWIDWANIPESAVKDYVFVGGNANYNYTEQSDVDLHILVDPNEIADCPDFIEDYFEDKKDLWSAKHNITIYNRPVEVYAQDFEDKFPESQGVFSLLQNEWISEPIHHEHLDLNKIPESDKANELKQNIDMMMSSNVDDRQMKTFKDVLKDMRNKSITDEGEFGSGNLLFKELRNLGYLKKMNDYIHSQQDKRLSL